MESRDLYMKHTGEMLADIQQHIASGDYHRAALVTAHLSSTLATMLSIYRFEAGVADERAKRDTLDSAERKGRESAAEFVRRIGMDVQ